jgi:choline kinase
MDALILAAGRGSRLGSLTADRPKALLDLGGITPLELALDVLVEHGVERVILVVGYMKEVLLARAMERAAGRLEIVAVWNPFWSVTNVIGSVWMALDELRGPFIYLHADTVFAPGILDDMLATLGSVVLPVDYRACEPEQMKAEVVDDRIRYLSKKLPPNRSAGEFIGVGLFRSDSVELIKGGVNAVLEDGSIDAYFEAAINWAIEHSGLEVVPVATNGRAWQEIDFPEDLESARALLPQLLTSGALPRRGSPA